MTGLPSGDGAGHPANGLNDIVHQRVRLGILAIAHEARRVEFGYLRTNLELSAGNLSQHLGVLEDAGLVAIREGLRRQARPHLGHDYEGRPGRTRRGDQPAQALDRPH
jgi:DNA-binding transcriptional ArsR family regulator